MTEYIKCGNTAETLASAIAFWASERWHSDDTKKLIESAYALSEIRVPASLDGLPDEVNIYDLVQWSEFNSIFLKSSDNKGIGKLLHQLAQAFYESPIHRDALRDVFDWTETIRGLQRCGNEVLLTYLTTLHRLCDPNVVRSVDRSV